MHRFALIFGLLVGCAADSSNDTGTSELALDSDASGTVDCTDLDHVLTCIHHPGTEACAHADINQDGAVDHDDLHDGYAAISEAGHQCADPAEHDTADHSGTPHDGSGSGSGHPTPGH